MKKIIKILLIPITLVIIYFLSLSYTINQNQNYESKITNRIKKHQKVDNIKYANYQEGYYIYTTDEKVIVLDNEYNEELIEDIKIISNKEKNDNIVYKDKKLMYEQTKLEKNKVTYTYYDIETRKEIKSIVLEK